MGKYLNQLNQYAGMLGQSQAQGLANAIGNYGTAPGQAMFNQAYNGQYQNTELLYYRNKEKEEQELEAKHPGLKDLREQYEMMKALCKEQGEVK